MIRRITLIGLSLLYPVVVLGGTAPSASAASAKNTTLFTCSPSAKGFSDAHCDTPNLEGKFGHVPIAVDVPTDLSVSNVKTKNETKEASPAIIKGTIVGVKSEITCNTTTGSGVATNLEPQSKVHKYIIVLVTVWSSCTVNKPALGCKIKEPIEFNLTGEGAEELGAGKNEMGMELKPTEGETFGEFTLEGCFISGTYKVTGTAIATGNTAPTAKHWGATAVLTNAMTKETLKLAGNPAELSTTKTLSMSGGGNPISVTTVT
jgi:hypothetical protein